MKKNIIKELKTNMCTKIANYKFVPIKSCDIPSVFAINIDCLKTPWSIKNLQEELHNPLARYIVCKDKSSYILGFGGIWLVCGEGNITNIAVMPSHRREGIAQNIIKELFLICQKENVKDITLEVRESNSQAIALYKKLGFKAEGTRLNFYTNPTENGIIMWKRNLI